MCKWRLFIDFNILTVIFFIGFAQSCDQDVKLAQRLEVKNDTNEDILINLKTYGQNRAVHEYDYGVGPASEHRLDYGIQCESQCQEGKKWRFTITVKSPTNGCISQFYAENDCKCQASTLSLVCDVNDCSASGKLLGQDIIKAVCD